MSKVGTPLVSVVTPALNAADTIEGTLRCVAGQTYENIEHIVVDGGSNDATLEKVAGFGAQRQLRWTSGPDAGMYDAINKGFDMAEGDILCYLNADDYYFPWSVSKAVSALEKADLIYGDMGVISNFGSQPKTFYIQFYPRFDLRYYTYSSTLGQPSVFWRRETFERMGGFDTSFKLLGDCEFWLRCGRSGLKLSKVDEVLSVQIDHAGTLRETQGSGAFAREWQKIFDTYAPQAGPIPSVRSRRLRKSLWWRWYMLRFLAASRRPNPAQWHLFLDWLRTKDLRIDALGVLRYLGPGSSDRNGVSWSDAGVLERELS